jgi:hypothetical protein
LTELTLWWRVAAGVPTGAAEMGVRADPPWVEIPDLPLIAGRILGRPTVCAG